MVTGCRHSLRPAKEVLAVGLKPKLEVLSFPKSRYFRYGIIFLKMGKNISATD